MPGYYRFAQILVSTVSGGAEQLPTTLIFVLTLQPILVFANTITPRLRNGFKGYDTPKNVYFNCDFETAEREAVRAAMNTN